MFSTNGQIGKGGAKTKPDPEPGSGSFTSCVRSDSPGVSDCPIILFAAEQTCEA